MYLSLGRSPYTLYTISSDIGVFDKAGGFSHHGFDTKLVA